MTLLGISVPRYNKEHWTQILHEARTNRQLCSVLAQFLADNGVELTGEMDESGLVTYGVKFNRPHIVEVERCAGRKHWTVKA